MPALSFNIAPLDTKADSRLPAFPSALAEKLNARLMGQDVGIDEISEIQMQCFKDVKFLI